MIIYHASVCLNFELRHQWQLSSLAEQEGAGLPQIICDVGALEGVHNPLRFPAGLAAAKNPRVELRYYPTPRDTFARRGLVRNEQVRRAGAAGAEWIFFADCDRLYHPRFFATLAGMLERPRLACGDFCATSIYRAETGRDEADALIAAGEREGHYHADAFVRAMPLATRWQRKMRHAAGGMQIVRYATICNHMGGLYVEPDRNRDRDLFADGQRARSDLHIRHVLPQCRLDLPVCIHLNHLRDRDAGRHIEDQR